MPNYGNAKNASQTYKGMSVSNSAAKRGYLQTSEIVSCSTSSNCINSDNYKGNVKNITCNNTSYIIYYNTNNTGFCAYNNTYGYSVTGSMPCSCMSQIYPSGSTCYGLYYC